ncbi:MAG: hypothetical protein OXC42_08990 [Gammaproteobacteria bacterium]|nr:hypothetical protein [Gammaproteobacteria bacterium]
MMPIWVYLLFAAYMCAGGYMLDLSSDPPTRGDNWRFAGWVFAPFIIMGLWEGIAEGTLLSALTTLITLAVLFGTPIWFLYYVFTFPSCRKRR